MENNITNKELFYHYAESLGIKINDAQRLMILALKSKEEALPQADVSGQSEQLVCGRDIKTCVFYKDGKCDSNDYCRDQVEQTN